jgi:hypothetical protein
VGAPIVGRVLWAQVGSEFEQSVTLSTDAAQTFRVTVPKGTRLLKAQLDDLEDATAEVTLLAYEVKEGQAIERRRVRGAPGVAPVVRIADPAAGEWRFVLEPYRLSAGQSNAIYRDVLVHEAYGQLKVEQATIQLDAVGVWETRLTSVPAALPVMPRRPVGVLALGIEAPQSTEEGGKAPAAEIFTEAVVPLGARDR